MPASEAEPMLRVWSAAATAAVSPELPSLSANRL